MKCFRLSCACSVGSEYILGIRCVWHFGGLLLWTLEQDVPTVGFEPVKLQAVWAAARVLSAACRTDGLGRGTACSSQPVKLQGWWICFHSWTRVSIAASSITNHFTPTYWHRELWSVRPGSISLLLPEHLTLPESRTVTQQVAGLKPGQEDLLFHLIPADEISNLNSLQISWAACLSVSAQVQSSRRWWLLPQTPEEEHVFVSYHKKVIKCSKSLARKLSTVHKPTQTHGWLAGRCFPDGSEDEP